MFFWSVSEHTWQIQNQKSYSENAHSFAASFVHINAHLAQESLFSRYDPTKMCIIQLFNLHHVF